MEFQKFQKIPRLSRICTITEKIDGSNGQIDIISHNDFYNNFNLPENEESDVIRERFLKQYCLGISKEGLYMFAGSRKRWLTPDKQWDNYGFAQWVKENSEELFKLGEGRHFGEWWGKGINRGYGMPDNKFHLFNVAKWGSNEVRPSCCGVVPVIYEGIFDTHWISEALRSLHVNGSIVAPGYMNPEGIVIFHKASSQLFKKTIVGDENPKNE